MVQENGLFPYALGVKFTAGAARTAFSPAKNSSGRKPNTLAIKLEANTS